MDSSTEEQRLEALLRYDILERDMMEELNGLTQVASNICDTPIALVNVLDRIRQVTKCNKGWDLNVIP